MLYLLWLVLMSVFANVKSRRNLALENLALRQQLAVLGRCTKRPRLTRVDRAFWLALARWWPEWRSVLMLVKPATVIAWHRKGFALYWARKSRKTTGRPRVNSEIRKLIKRMATDNIGWGAPRIDGELLKLGFSVRLPSRATCRVDARSRRRRSGALSCETTCIAPSTDHPPCVIANANSRLRQLFSTRLEETTTVFSAFKRARRTDPCLTGVTPHSRIVPTLDRNDTTN
jgi:hypothetical protein